MKTKFFLIIAFASIFSFNAMSQLKSASMSFEKTSWDFGKIKEDGGLAVCTFDFTNTGAEPIVISNVETSCGCTTPDWSRQPIPPAGKGFIRVQFDPRNRPGTFNKNITIHSNSSNSPINLTISGEVLKKEPTVNDNYKFAMGNLRLKSNMLSFNNIFSDEIQTQEIEIINNGQETLNLEFQQIPNHLKAVFEPSILAPGKIGIIKISYDAKTRNDWDYLSDNLIVKINNNIDYNNRLTITAIIKERFTEEQIKNAPAVELINGTVFNFGKIKQGEVKEFEFQLKNTGKSDLIIRKTRATCGCTATSPKESVIKPGLTTTIKVTFNSAGKTGKQNKLVTVITNIPDQQQNKIILRIEGEIE